MTSPQRLVAQLPDREVEAAARGVEPGEPIFVEANRDATRQVRVEEIEQAAARELEGRRAEMAAILENNLKAVGIGAGLLLLAILLGGG